MQPARWTHWLAPSALVLCVCAAAPTMTFAQPESCDDAGGGANDIRSLGAHYVAGANAVVVTMTLCAPPDVESKYRVRFDTGPNLIESPQGSGTFVTATLFDGNPRCLTTDDTGLMLHRHRTHGPGAIVVSGAVITFTVAVEALSPALPPGGRLRYRADVQERGITDQAPNVDATDGCSKPQGPFEMQSLYARDVNEVIGTQAFDIRRVPSRLAESAMGNLVSDAMRVGTGADATLTNSGGLRADMLCTRPVAGEQPCEITFREAFGVLPFGNLAVLVTLSGAQLEAALLNGVAPACGLPVPTGRFPQVSGLRVEFACTGLTPVITGIWKTPAGVGGPIVPLGPADTVRIVTNDFMVQGGDGYTMLASGADVALLDRELLELLIAYVGAHSPVAPVIEGRITRQ